MKTVAEVMRLKDTHSTYRQTHPRKRSAHLSRGNSTLKRYTLTHVYCSTVYRSHDVEATYVSINRWMDKENMVHIHSGILLGHKKDEIIPFAITWMDLHLIMLSEVRQRKTNTIWYHLNVKSKKMKQMNLLAKQKQTHRENKHGYQRERGSRDKTGVLD